MTNIGNRVKEARTAYNLTQRQLGKAAGVSKTMIHLIEKNLRLPSIRTLIKISKLFDLNLSFFLMSNKQTKDTRNEINSTTPTITRAKKSKKKTVKQRKKRDSFRRKR